MSKKKLLRLPELRLTPDDVHELRPLSNDLERETLRTYEEFLFRDRHHVDDKRWRPVRSHEDLRAYRERSCFKDTHTAHAGMARALRNNVYQHFEIGPQAAMSANSKMPVMMCVGSVPGQLDDIMYGSAVFDSASLRTRNHYMKDPYEENVVLSVLDGPTPDEPFRFLGLTWYLKTFHMPMIISDRDILLLAGMRFGRLSNGERVGLNLYHSVEHRDFPVMKAQSILRMELTLGMVYRQLPDQRLDVFMIGFVEPHGSTPEMFGVQDAAKILLLSCHFPDIALRKKLHWRMREKQRRAQRNRGGSHTESDKARCSLCIKSLGGFFTSSGCTCQICGNRVCNKCSLKRRIIIESTRVETTYRPFDFCLRCTLETKGIPAFTAALEELCARSSDSHKHLSTYSSSSSSTSSI